MSLELSGSNLPESSLNVWSFDIYATAPNGDASHETSVQFAIGADPCE